MAAILTYTTTDDTETNDLQFGVEPNEVERSTVELQSASSKAKDKVIEEQIGGPALKLEDWHIKNGDTLKVTSGVINMMPDLEWYTTLPFIQKSSPFDLATEAAEICAHILGHPLLCQILLRVDAVKWYNSEKGKGNDIEQQARDHIRRVNNEEHVDDKSFSRSGSRRNGDQNVEDLWSCDKKILVNGHLQSCGFFVKESHCIYKTSEFYAAARNNGLPVITICPIEHYTNEDWVRTPAAWRAVLIVLNYIEQELKLNESPFYEIYVNYGKWHSQICNGCSDGHAHINIFLTPAAIEACGKTSSKLSCLSGSTKLPSDYRLDDAKTLEEELKKNKGGKVSIAGRLDEEATSSY